MDVSSDYRDLFRIFNRHKVKYLVVGAYAVAYYAEPRFSKDIDIWVKADHDNAEKVYEALKEFGAPLEDISPADFIKEDLVYQIGVAPIRIDILMGQKGVDFDKAWRRRKKSKYGIVPVNVMGLEELILTKKKIGRSQDLLDIERLKKKK